MENVRLGESLAREWEKAATLGKSLLQWTKTKLEP